MSEELSLREIRLQKLARMRELGHDPFAVEKFKRTDTADGLIQNFALYGGDLPDDQVDQKTRISFVGRVVSYRLMGKAGFAHLSDGDGKIQGYFRKNDLGDTAWELYNLLDLGDHVGVEGYLFTTKTGEKSIHVENLVPLNKVLVNVPVTYYGLTDTEVRYRHRHLDLIANQDSRKNLINRAKIISSVRRYFDSQEYLEVETPLLQLEAGGASARPFLTRYNAYDIDVKLRISLELYLKRLLCGDIPRVYEIGRVFRNEGADATHNPEFTLLEFYESFGNLETMMQRVEECFRFVANEVFGSAVVERADGSRIDFGKPWNRVNLLGEIERFTGMTAADLSDFDVAIARAKELDIPAKARAAGDVINLSEERNLGGLIEKLLEVFVEPTLQEPTFVVGYPIETSPLAKKDPNDPRMTRRFEGYVLGREICNAFSEINDPIDQRERFEQQLREAAKGDDEAHPMDEDFLFALESGMPPAGGCGIGLDRMAMLLTGSDHIREVMMFPFMRPITNAPTTEE